jgi:hypothetical protein
MAGWRKVDGGVALYMMDAVAAAAHLAAAMKDLRYTVCNDRNGYADITRAKRHCRELKHALEMVDHCLRYPDREEPAGPAPLKVVKPD